MIPTNLYITIPICIFSITIYFLFVYTRTGSIKVTYTTGIITSAFPLFLFGYLIWVLYMTIYIFILPIVYIRSKDIAAWKKGGDDTQSSEQLQENKREGE